LKDYNVKVELSASTRVGFHQYTFPSNAKTGVIIDLGHTLQSHQNLVNEVEIINDREIRGYKVTKGWARDHHVFFHAVFSEPFESTLATEAKRELSNVRKLNKIGSKVLLNFQGIAGKKLLVKVAISSVDYEGAKNNLKEIPHWNFERVKESAATEWMKWLDRITITGGTPDQQKIFYSAMYHTAISPNMFTDRDGRYWGMDKKVHQSSKASPNYSVFSLWDTFRAFHPFMTIVNPSRNEAWIRSLLQKYRENGTLPMWELSSNETGTMIGYHAVPVIVDAYMKGYRNFDVQLAYAAIVQASQYDTVSVAFPDDEVKHGLMPKAKKYNENLGYIPADQENESVSKALEFAYNDWCIAQMAKALGKDADYKKYFERSKRYVKYFDARVGFMRGINTDGSWKTPFNPRFSNHRKDEYVEGNAWQWSWFVPHDVKGLIGLYDSEEAFTLKLDSLFNTSSTVDGNNSSADISGLIGQYAHGNEPSHHIAYLYNYVGQPWKTQDLADKILTTLYFNDSNGLSGNEDCGQMSAWFLMSSMGLYQVSPGDPTYTLGRPLFDEVKIRLENGKEFTIKAMNNGAKNKYVQEVKLNGKKLSAPFIAHEDVMRGGILEFIMTAVPMKSLTSSRVK
jgi:predicted alpha-1,2-mannosidase